MEIIWQHCSFVGATIRVDVMSFKLCLFIDPMFAFSPSFLDNETETASSSGVCFTYFATEEEENVWDGNLQHEKRIV
jgi:hypothetical protein